MLSLQTVLPDTLELLKTLTQMPELEDMRLVEPHFFHYFKLYVDEKTIYDIVDAGLLLVD